MHNAASTDVREYSGVLVAGVGFVGCALVRSLHEDGVRVEGITLDVEKAAALSVELRVPIHAADLSDGDSLASVNVELPRPLAVVHCASSNRGGPEVYRRVFVEGVSNLARRFTPELLIFTSSTSVYGQREGEWVDETSATNPQTETSQMLLAAEARVHEAGGIVGRLAGLYGPGRFVYLEKLRDGTATLDGGGGRHVNQVHRDDVVGALRILMARGARGEVYNVVDDSPRPLGDLYAMLAARIGTTVPTSGGNANRKRALTDKRVSNARLRALGWKPRYPDFQSAMDAGAV